MPLVTTREACTVLLAAAALGAVAAPANAAPANAAPANAARALATPAPAVSRPVAPARSATPSHSKAAPPLFSQVLSQSAFPGFLLGKSGSVLPDPESAWAAEVDRQLVIDQARRVLISRDYRQLVEVDLIQWRNRKFAEVMTNPQGTADPRPPALPPGAAATVGTISATFAQRAALFYEGPVSVRIAVTVSGPRANQAAGLLLARAAARQSAALTPRPSSNVDVLHTSRLKAAMTRDVVTSLVLAMLVAGLLTGMRDPSVRRRWRLRLTGRPPIPSHAIDVTALATVLRRRTALKNSIRGAVTIGAVAAAMVSPLGTLQSAGLVAAVVVGWSFVESRPGYLKQGRSYLPPLFRGWAFVIGGLGMAVSITLIAAGLAVVWLGILTQIFGLPTADTKQLGAVRLLFLLVGVGALLLSAIPTQLVRRLAMRRLACRLDADDSRPVLLLRSFADDEIKLRARRARRNSPLDRIALRRWERFEEILAAALGHVGPVEALSRPGTRLPPLGAARRSYATEDWQAAVQTTIAAAALVVVNVARSAALRWEIEQIRDLGALDRAVFVIPPSTPGERRLRLRALAGVLRVSPGLLDVERPGLEILAVLVADPHRPALITSGVRDDVSYELALEVGERTLAEYRAGADFVIPALVAVDAVAPEAVAAMFHEAGKAPRVRPWYRRPIVVVAMLASVTLVVVPLLAQTGTAVDNVDAVVALHAGTRILLAEVATDTAIAVQDGVSGSVDIVRVDPRSRSANQLGSLPLIAQGGTLGDGWLVLSAGQQDRVSGFDLSSRRQWTVNADGIPRGVAVSRGRVYVALAGADAVDELDLASGRVVRRVAVGGAPWDVAVAGDAVYVTLAGVNAVVRLDPRTLAVLAREPAPSSPRDIFLAGRWTWLFGAEHGQLWQAGTSGLPAARADSDILLPVLAHGAGRVALLSGTNDVEILDDQSGRLTRHLHFAEGVRTIGVTRDRQLLIGVYGAEGLGVIQL